MRIGVLCSGGDAPGMNACVRAVVRTAISRGNEVVGINRGYAGLLEEDFYLNSEGQPLMNSRSVSGWSKYGGAFLRCSRSKKFATEEGREQAAAILQKHDIGALVLIGGDGTFRGGTALAGHWKGQIVGCPGTIDNDLYGTDYTIGFSTAVRTAVEAVDKIRDTAESHERMFLIEVMGRHSGYIAVQTAISCGAEVVAIPETITDVDAIIERVKWLKEAGKRSIIMIVAEGDEEGGAMILDQQLTEHQCPFSTRVVILGHLQRGGSPTPEDRFRATLMGSEAVEAISRGETGVMIGTQDFRVVSVPFESTYAAHRTIPPQLLAILDSLAV